MAPYASSEQENDDPVGSHRAPWSWITWMHWLLMMCWADVAAGACVGSVRPVLRQPRQRRCRLWRRPRPAQLSYIGSTLHIRSRTT